MSVGFRDVAGRRGGVASEMTSLRVLRHQKLKWSRRGDEKKIDAEPQRGGDCTAPPCPAPPRRGSRVAHFTPWAGLAGRGRQSGRRGRGEEASMRAGFRMMGRAMGATPTCRGDASGCRIRRDWLVGEGPRAGDTLRGGGVRGQGRGTGDDRSVPGGGGGGGGESKGHRSSCCTGIHPYRSIDESKR